MRARGLGLAAYVVTLFLAFPHPVAGRVLDLGLLCAWLAPAALVLALDGLAPRRAAALGWLAGWVAHAAVLHWIYVVTVVYGRAPPPAGVAAPLALAAYMAVFTGLFAAGWCALARRGRASPLAAALLWTATDHLRSFVLTGFPWATLGYAQHHNAPLMALVPWTGVYGLSFASALGGAALAAGWRDWRARRRPRAATWGALAGLLAAHAGGALLPADSGEGLATLRVAVLQGNIDQGVKWSPEWAGRTLAVYEDLTRTAARRGARVVVWPETAVPGSLETDPALRARLAALARELDAALVVGGVGIDRDPARGATRYYDSAYLIDPERGFTDRYDKTHLVPFGEYVPLRDALGLFFETVASGIASTDVSAGERPRAVDLRPRDAGRTLTAGVPICYELLFPGLVRHFVRDGAEVLFAITNDAWYGRTGAPYQFLAITALRSAETRVWTARAANTGVSAFIDERGRVRERTPIFERALLVRDVPLRPAPAGGSFYARHGDVFAGACWLGLAGLAALAVVRGAG